MGSGHAFSTLSRLLTHWEGGAVDVLAVTPRDEDVVSTGAVVVDVEVRVPLVSAFEGGEERTLDADVADGTLTVEVSESTRLLPAGPVDDVSVESRDVLVRADGYVDVDLSLRIETDPADPSPEQSRTEPSDGRSVAAADGGQPSVVGPAAVAATDGGPTAAEGSEWPERNPDVPPYDDAEYLQALYESYDTFAEMAEEFERDVTSETVRRYMIDAGVHEPTSYDTDGPDHSGENADGTGATSGEDDHREPATDVSPERDDGDVEVLVTDGIGLPDGMTVEDLVRTVRRSNTLYEVTREIDVERAEARDLLDDLNLLDLVVGRLSRKDDRTITREEAVERMRQSVT